MSKEEMLEEMVLRFNYTVSEYDPFFNRYIKLKKEPIRRIYEKVMSGFYKTRHEFEIDIEKTLTNEKRRLHDDDKKSRK